MQEDPSVLGSAGMLPQGYGNIKGRIHRLDSFLLNVVAPRKTLNGSLSHS